MWVVLIGALIGACSTPTVPTHEPATQTNSISNVAKNTPSSSPTVEFTSPPSAHLRTSTSSPKATLTATVSNDPFDATRTAYYWMATPVTSTPTPLATEQPGTFAYINTFPKIDLNKLPTASAAPAIPCPVSQVSPQSTPVLNSWAFPNESQPNPASAADILFFLNAYGPEALVGKNAIPSNQIIDSDTITAYQDFTNDKIPEIVITQTGWFRIYGCKESHYQLLFELGPDPRFFAPYILAIQDLNRNGIPEIYLKIAAYSQSARDLGAVEWDGERFRWILLYPDGQTYVTVAPGYLSFQDINGDGFQEVIANFDIPIWTNYDLGLPWRKAKQIFKWNGKYFLFYKENFDPPVFRYQAVEDGDRASLAGDYVSALNLYQQAIFSDKLEWYSAERRGTMHLQWESQFDPTPQPTPTLPNADPDEYDNLAAYASYRIMVIHALHGYFSDAQVVYNDLQKHYLEAKNGSIYAKLATEFWKEYAASRDMSKGCSKALDFARQNWLEVTQYLGNTDGGATYFGNQGLKYEMDGNLLCPF
jgi:hypothetical protein